MASQVNGHAADAILTLSELAGATGRSLSALCHLKARGKLSTLPDGRRVYYGIAAAELARLRPRSDPRSTEAAPPAQAPAAALAPPAEAPGTPDYRTSRALREAMAAERERMAMEREAGSLLRAADVYDSVDDAAVLLRQALEQLPARLATRLAGLDEAGIAALLHAEIDRELHGLADRLRHIGQGGGDDGTV